MGGQLISAGRGDGRHPYYGGCDGFGPLGMCSECTGVIHCDDGSFTANEAGDRKLTQGQAADAVREFLLREVECAALAAGMHISKPKGLMRFVGRWMEDVLPRNFDSPDRNPEGEKPKALSS